MVGASLALALARTPLRVVLVEAVAPDSQAQPSFDERTTALGNASRRIFESLGIWERLGREAAAIRTIHVSDAGRFGFARLQARDQGVEAFGYVVPNRVIGGALWDVLAARTPGLALRVPARPRSILPAADAVQLTLESAAGTEQLSARLVVAADGADSLVRHAAGIEARVREYHQMALVVNVAADRPHDGTAYERFTSAGPLAVLPLRDGSFTLVWARAPADAQRLMQLEEAAFLRELQGHFGWRVGRFVRAGRRAAYPLALTRAARTVAPRTVLIGNAAQALHPVAGQGFNLGLRDAAALAELLAAAAGDVGGAELLERFAHERAADRRGVIRFTDSLVRLFADERQLIGAARNLGLLLFDLAPPAKSALARVSAGFGGRTPRLARGLSL
jgi:2-octaprenyl-6-methoxyphenol hydroxylase